MHKILRAMFQPVPLALLGLLALLWIGRRRASATASDEPIAS